MVARPHFLLFCDTHLSDSHKGHSNHPAYTRRGGGRWHFVLERIDRPERMEAADNESSVNCERLALLSVVRGLEALEQPSHVTLVTTSRYVSRGLRYGLSSWRDADYQWERFGEQRPIRNSDLWRRVDKALHYHGVECRLIHAGQGAAALSDAPTCAAGHAEIDKGPVHAAGSLVQPRWIDKGDPAQLTALRGNGTAQGTPLTGTASSLSSRVKVENRTARNLHHSNLVFAGMSANLWDLLLRRNWWSLALAWIKWWRGRMPTRPAIYGT